MVSIIITIGLTINCGQTFAHENTIVVKHFGNVKVRVETAWRDEGINKMAIWGQLAEKLCKELNYTDSVFLHFGYCIPDYLVSFDKGRIESMLKMRRMPFPGGPSTEYTPEPVEFLKEDAIVIRQLTDANGFQAQTTLKLLEYAILNLNHIKTTQTFVEVDINYCKNRFISIDLLEIKKILNTPNSDIVNNVLNQKVYRPEQDFSYGISYYWQNNRYFVFQKSFFNNQESVITDFENIYDVKKIGMLSALIFDSDSSYYYVLQSGSVHFGRGGTGGQQGNPQLSQRQVIEDRKGNRPFTVTDIGGGKIAISFSFWDEWKEDENSEYSMVGDRVRTLLYLTKEDRLIQDLDKLLKNQ
jgi:hypothetical protein